MRYCRYGLGFILRLMLVERQQGLLINRWRECCATHRVVMTHTHIKEKQEKIECYTEISLNYVTATRKEIWGSCCVRCSSAASRSCSATFETAVASKSATALLSCMWERCGPKAENAVVLNRLFSQYVHGQLLSQNFSTAFAPHSGNAAVPK